MDGFVSRFKEKITGVLSGFDRLVFRGSLIPLIRERGMHVLLAAAGVRLLDFKDYALKTSNRVKEAALADARAQDRPVPYLEFAKTSKEDLARKLLAEHPIDEGLVCGLSAVEPCMSFEYHRSRNPGTRPQASPPQVSAHLQILLAPGLRLHECPAADLVSLQHPDLPQRP